MCFHRCSIIGQHSGGDRRPGMSAFRHRAGTLIWLAFRPKTVPDNQPTFSTKCKLLLLLTAHKYHKIWHTQNQMSENSLGFAVDAGMHLVSGIFTLLTQTTLFYRSRSDHKIRDSLPPECGGSHGQIDDYAGSYPS